MYGGGLCKYPHSLSGSSKITFKFFKGLKLEDFKWSCDHLPRPYMPCISELDTSLTVILSEAEYDSTGPPPCDNMAICKNDKVPSHMEAWCFREITFESTDLIEASNAPPDPGCVSYSSKSNNRSLNTQGISYAALVHGKPTGPIPPVITPVANPQCFPDCLDLPCIPHQTPQRQSPRSGSGTWGALSNSHGFQNILMHRDIKIVYVSKHVCITYHSYFFLYKLFGWIYSSM